MHACGWESFRSPHRDKMACCVCGTRRLREWGREERGEERSQGRGGEERLTWHLRGGFHPTCACERACNHACCCEDAHHGCLDGLMAVLESGTGRRQWQREAEQWTVGTVSTVGQEEGGHRRRSGNRASEKGAMRVRACVSRKEGRMERGRGGN